MAHIEDVARHAGLSVVTVSRAITMPEHVSAASRVRLMAAVEALGFAPNAAARSLRVASAPKILVTVPNIANPFFDDHEPHRGRGSKLPLCGPARRHALHCGRRGAICDSAGHAGGRWIDISGSSTTSGSGSGRRTAGAAAPIVKGCESDPQLSVPSAHIDNAAAAEEAMDLSMAWDTDVLWRWRVPPPDR